MRRGMRYSIRGAAQKSPSNEGLHGGVWKVRRAVKRATTYIQGQHGELIMPTFFRGTFVRPCYSLPLCWPGQLRRQRIHVCADVLFRKPSEVLARGASGSCDPVHTPLAFDSARGYFGGSPEEEEGRGQTNARHWGIMWASECLCAEKDCGGAVPVCRELDPGRCVPVDIDMSLRQLLQRRTTEGQPTVRLWRMRSR